MKKRKTYVVAEADNVSSDIQVSEVFNDKIAARKRLTEQYNDIIDCISDFDSIETKTKKVDSYTILTHKGNYYYGQVKMLQEVAE